MELSSATAYPACSSIASIPTYPGLMYVGVEEGGVFRTHDGGQSFESRNSGLYDDVHTVAVDPKDSRRLYATTGRGFYISNNAGASGAHEGGLQSHLHGAVAGDRQ